MAPKVTVYATPLCASCERLKDYLRSRQVAFSVRDLLVDPDAAAFLESRNIYIAPALQVDDTLIAGPELKRERIDALLGD